MCKEVMKAKLQSNTILFSQMTLARPVNYPIYPMDWNAFLEKIWYACRAYDRARVVWIAAKLMAQEIAQRAIDSNDFENYYETDDINDALAASEINFRI